MGRGRLPKGWFRATESFEAALFHGGWGARLAYRLGLQGAVETRLHALSLPTAAPSMPPLRIGFASDFHAGPLTDPRLLARAFESLAAASPHLVLLGGDFISFRTDEIDLFCEQVRRLNPPHGIYAVLGNHDLWADDAMIVKRLESAGVRVLVNENVRLGGPFEALFVCGIDDPVAGDPDPADTFRGAEGTRILLMHSPGGLPLLRGYRFDVAFTGHTHGGQIALPGGIPIVLPPGNAGRRYAHGEFKGSNGQGVLIVSKGVGLSGLPIRLFARSEVHLCTIQWRSQKKEGML
ncbi:MAG: metallophosphoesterase [Nitrospirae bacterium]|nr:metallophosphoesterase [Candidatus Manganitrophaceae bacterium]